MIAILTQSKAMINLDNTTTLSAVKDENEQVAIVADQSYVLGYYNNEQDASMIIVWIANTIGSHSNDNNICITMPLAQDLCENEDNTNAEND